MKRHIYSALITFLTTFAIVVVPDIDAVTWNDIQTGSVLGLIFIGVRAGVKGVLEYFISTQK